MKLRRSRRTRRIRGKTEDQGEEVPGKDAHDEEEIEKEAEGEQEAEEAGDMLEELGVTKQRDGVDEDEQPDETGDDEEAEEEMGTHDEVRAGIEAMEQGVAANNRDGAWRDCRLANMTYKEREGRRTTSGGEKRKACEEDGDPVERGKRPLETCEVFDCPTPGDRPNERSKDDDSESEDNTATEDLRK